MTDFEKNEKNIKRNVNKDLFEKISDHQYGDGKNTFNYTYGQVASWLTWNRDAKGNLAGSRAAHNDWNDGHLDFDEDILLSKERRFTERLTTDIVFVGLNMSGNGTPSSSGYKSGRHWPFQNARGHETIIKTFFNTEAEGGYFTDIIKPDAGILKGVKDLSKSEKVRAFLKEHQAIVKDHIRIFKEELVNIKADKPLLIVFGGDAYWCLKTGFDSGIINRRDFTDIVQIWHYGYAPRRKTVNEYITNTRCKLAKYITISQQADIIENPYLQELDEAKCFLTEKGFSMSEPGNNNNQISCQTDINDITFYISCLRSGYKFSWRTSNEARAKSFLEQIPKIQKKLYPNATLGSGTDGCKMLWIPLNQLEEALEVIEATSDLIGYTGGSK
jgi:hypothetical protein